VDDVHTLFVGDGVLRGKLEHTAAALGIAGRTHFSGFVNQTELPAIYRAANVLVLPSAHEPFGLVVNEAFACGIPAIVSSACGSAGDLVQEGRTGYVVPVGAVETLASRLHLLANDPALQEAMSREASRLIEAGDRGSTLLTLQRPASPSRQRRGGGQDSLQRSRVLFSDCGPCRYALPGLSSDRSLSV
jgi:glycosyltransferase involved in cell wall biosynthesis